MSPLVAAAFVGVGVLVALLVVLAPFRTRLPKDRRRPVARASASASAGGPLAAVADVASKVMDRVIRSRADRIARALDLAGIRMRPQDFALLVVVVAIVGVAIATLLGAGLLALPFAALAVGIVVVVVRGRVGARRTAFAGQLGGTLQLMSSSLRAGQSMDQALQSVAKEAEEPTSSELARIVNESRVGRPIVEALEEAADRMASEDFRWATQAIAINREVGGSLSEVLDGVAATIRERDEIRAQVATLSAEGRLSAVILMALPAGVALFLLLTNPGYLAPFVTHPLGPVLIGVSVVLFVIGGIWLKKTVEIQL